MRYVPRNDWVIVRTEIQDKLGGIVIPQQSAEGVKHIVVEMGPDVREDLEIGDRVILGGPVEGDHNQYLLFQIPGTNDLFHVRDRNVLCTVTE